MLRLAKLARRFKDDESGAAMVEYAVIMALVIAIGAAVFNVIGQDLALIFANVGDTVAGIAGAPEGLD